MKQIKKYIIIGIIIGSVVLIPFAVIFGVIFVMPLYEDLFYPAWDFACHHRITIENYSSYDESQLVKIAESAIIKTFPDINMPDELVRMHNSQGELSVLTMNDLESTWPVVIDALEKNDIKAEFNGTGCT